MCHSRSLCTLTTVTAARTCAYAPDGMTIAVGLGAPADDATGPGRSKKDGALVVLNEEDLTVIFETRDTKKWIRHCRFSPDNNVLALASGDSSIACRYRQTDLPASDGASPCRPATA